MEDRQEYQAGNEPKEYFTVTEAALRIGISPYKLYRLINAGKIKVIRANKVALLPAADVEALRLLEYFRKNPSVWVQRYREIRGKGGSAENAEIA